MLSDALTALCDPYHIYSESAYAPEEMKGRHRLTRSTTSKLIVEENPGHHAFLPTPPAES